MSATLEYPQKHPISAEEYLRMGEAAVFAPDVRLELIEGEIVEMAPIGSPHAACHAACVDRLTELFFQRTAGRVIVSVQRPVVVSDRSVPQPDLVLLGQPTFTRARTRQRRTCCLPWRSRTRVIHVFREPAVTGYRTRLAARQGESVACVALPEATFEVAEVFPG